MPQILQAPPSIDGQVYVLLRYDREMQEFELCLPGSDASYLLGDKEAALAYFARAGRAALGERAVSAAFSFGASQAVVAEGRAWGIDTTNPLLDKKGAKRDVIQMRERMWGKDDNDDEVFVL